MCKLRLYCLGAWVPLGNTASHEGLTVAVIITAAAANIYIQRNCAGTIPSP